MEQDDKKPRADVSKSKLLKFFGEEPLDFSPRNFDPDFPEEDEFGISRDVWSFIHALYHDFTPGKVPLGHIESSFSSDVEWTFGGKENKRIPLCGTYFGHEGIFCFLAQVQELLQINRWETKEIISQADKAVVIVKAAYTVHKTGKSFEIDEIHIHTIKRNRSTRVQIYFDFTPVLDAFQE